MSRASAVPRSIRACSCASADAEAIAARAAAAVAPSPTLFAVEGGETKDARVSPRRSPFADVFSSNVDASEGVFG